MDAEVRELITNVTYVPNDQNEASDTKNNKKKQVNFSFISTNTKDSFQELYFDPLIYMAAIYFCLKKVKLKNRISILAGVKRNSLTPSQ